MEPPPAKKFKRRRLRKKVTEDKDHRWEVTRQDAWLREALTTSSESELLNVRSWPNDGLVGLVLDGCHIVGQMGAEDGRIF
jgi:hypothetical protein